MQNIITSTSNQGAVPSASGGGYRKVWICEVCTFENEDVVSTERCDACGAFRHRNKQTQKLSLAQKRGLVAAPAPRLSSNAWAVCEQQAENRGDCLHPCSICREPFGMKRQVILSCSHIFHLDCIVSFERFLRTDQRVCPLCRKQNYEKRSSTKAAIVYQQQSAINIQRIMRGFLARKHSATLFDEFYRQGRGEHSRRLAHLAKRMSKTSDRLINVLQTNDDSLDSLLAEFDKSINWSRQVFQGSNQHEDERRHTGVEWDHVANLALRRQDSECPICLNQLSTRPLRLLSCSHVFHSECLRAFEGFNIYAVALCPVCRSAYTSIDCSAATLKITAAVTSESQ